MINRYTILYKTLQLEQHNLSCYSQNWSMTEPKEGCEEKWEEARKSITILKQMLDELGTTYEVDGEYKKYKVFVCSIDSYDAKPNLDKKPVVDCLEVSLCNSSPDHPDKRILRCGSLEISDYLLSEYDTERHNRYDEGKGSTVKIYVDNINYIRKIEWFEEK